MNNHQPVMIDEIIEAFRAAELPQRRYFDGTFGRGGHLRAVLNDFADIKAVALDCDQQAIEFGEKEFSVDVEDGRLRFVHGLFSEFKIINQKLGNELFDLMLLDLGVSSPQFDQAERGFSFSQPGPLDMRMDQSSGFTAATVINQWNEKQLQQLFLNYGEIRRPFKVVRMILEQRKKTPFTTTKELADLIVEAEGWRNRGHHPATRYFMALRITVNQELEQLQAALPDLIEGLEDKGRLAVLTFHSLEDRIVKRIFRGLTDKGKPVNKKVIIAKQDELKRNPRSRSAKLRVFERRFHES